MSEEVYFKRNVNYVVGGRWFPTDAQGWTMTNDFPYLAVPTSRLRDFKIANKRAIMEGLIVQSDAPSLDYETTNAITDEEATELVKQYLKLKQRLQEINSLATAAKLLNIAKETNKSDKTIKLIEARVAELSPEDDDFGTRGE